jgi:predicted nucleic acid-binding Zn ribbon protein
MPAQTARAPHRGTLVASRRCPMCQGPLGDRPNQRACSAKCRAALSRGRRQRALNQKYARLAELLRQGLRIVEAR